MGTIRFLCLVGWIIPSLLLSQKNHSKNDKDFVITLKGDTIYGKFVGNMTPAITSVRISFIEEGTQNRVSYKAHQIKSWHPRGANFYFESKEYRPVGMKRHELGLGVYMKCFTPYRGYVRLYEYYNTDKEQGHTQIFLEKGRRMTEINMFKFRTQMAQYFSDYPDLSKEITEGKYKKKDIIKIVDTYNSWKNKN